MSDIHEICHVFEAVSWTTYISVDAVNAHEAVILSEAQRHFVIRVQTWRVVVMGQPALVPGDFYLMPAF